MSLHKRLTLLLLSSLLLMLVPLGIFIFREARNATVASFERMAFARLGYYRTVTPGDLPQLIGLAQELGGYGFLLSQGQITYTDTGTHTLPYPLTQAAVAGESYRGLHEGHLYVMLPMGSSSVALAIQVDEVGILTSRLLLAYLIAAAGLFLLVGVVSHRVLQLLLLPLNRLSHDIAGRSSDNLEPFAIPQLPELKAMVSRLNTLLARLEYTLKRTAQQEHAARHFAAHASHELRTPLTALRGYLEVLERSPDEPRARAGAWRETDRLQRLLEALLALARLEGRAHVHAERIDVDNFVRERFPNLPVRGSGCFWAEPDLAELALKAVLENAQMHGAKPIMLRFQQDKDHAFISIEDSGEGFPFILTREQISDEKVKRGHGLGLAIAGAVMQAHRGTLEQENKPEGGARVVLGFPTPAA